MAYEQAWKVSPKMTKDELYESLVDDIRKKYNGKLSDLEAHTAARNFIEFVKILLKYHEKSNWLI